MQDPYGEGRSPNPRRTHCLRTPPAPRPTRRVAGGLHKRAFRACRDPELGLASPHDVWEHPPHRLADGDLAPAVLYLEVVRQRHAIVHELVIEQRHPRLE